MTEYLQSQLSGPPLMDLKLRMYICEGFYGDLPAVGHPSLIMLASEILWNSGVELYPSTLDTACMARMQVTESWSKKV